MGKLRDYLPALRYGHKIHPEDMAGMIGLPYIGEVYYADPTNGSDTSSNGKSGSQAFATVATAYAAATSAKHDVVLINPAGGTGRTSETSLITWAKRFTHLIGNAAPSAQSPRAGMNFAGATGTATSSLTVSENGCIFSNITLAGTDDVNVPVTISGAPYNAFLGVDFKGALNATSGDDTASRALYITGSQENRFEGCTFGQDTIMRSAANATVEFAGASSRNLFENCRFIAAIDAATPVHVLFTGTFAIDRFIEFRGCTFDSFSANDATAMTACMNLSAQTATGRVMVTGLPFLSLGITDWEATASGRIHMQAFSVTANTLGLAIKPTVS